MEVRNQRATRNNTKNLSLAFLGIVLLASHSLVYLSANQKGPNDASVSIYNPISALKVATQNESGWKTDQLPIMKSITDGFHPIYVFSKVQHEEVKSEEEFSQVKQDKIILALTQANDAKITNPSKTKFFVDLASNDALILSNSYRLEQNGWKGLCIEPNPIYWYKLAASRSCTIIGGFVGGTSEHDGTEVDVVLHGVSGGIASNEFDNKPGKSEGKMVKRNLVSIQTIFSQTNVPSKIDYFSLDVEGAETIVMADFPFGSYSFKFITIERPKADLVQLLESNGYKQVFKLTRWGETLWANTLEVLLSQQEIEDIVKQYPNQFGWGQNRK